MFPIRVFQQLGIETIILTNAAGGINQSFKVGDIMIINDHISIPGLAGLNPLKGPNDDRLGPRFPALSDAYDHELRAKFLKAAESLGVEKRRSIHEGTYVFVSGPTYESRAEVRFLQTIGADSVGMSTVPEVVVARHAGIKVLALSLVTNIAVVEPVPSAREPLKQSLETGKATHAEVIEAGNEAAKDVQDIVEQVVGQL